MKKLSIVIPVYNEIERLPITIKALNKLSVPAPLQLNEVIFVNDGSTDDTLKTLKLHKFKLEKKLATKVKIVSYDTNKGKGYAVKQGMLASTSNYTLFMDADLSTPLKELKKFVPLIKSNEKVIIGTRKANKAKITKAQPLYRQLLGKGFTLLSQLMLNTWVSDFTCGFKMYEKSALQQVFSNAQIERWGYDAEILFLTQKYGYTINEVPVEWKNDERSKVSVVGDMISSFTELVQIRLYDISGSYDENSLPQKIRYSLRFLTSWML